MRGPNGPLTHTDQSRSDRLDRAITVHERSTALRSRFSALILLIALNIHLILFIVPELSIKYEREPVHPQIPLENAPDSVHFKYVHGATVDPVLPFWNNCQGEPGRLEPSRNCAHGEHGLSRSRNVPLMR